MGPWPLSPTDHHLHGQQGAGVRPLHPATIIFMVSKVLGSDLCIPLQTIIFMVCKVLGSDLCVPLQTIIFMVSKVPGSDLCVPLHVESVHLLKDEGDGVLADDADVRLESDDLLVGHIEA